MKKVSASRVVSKRPNWQLKLLSQAIAVVGAGMQAPTVLAHPCPANPVHGAKTTTCFVADGETATILTGGSIIVADAPAIIYAGAGSKTILNSGTVQSTGPFVAIDTERGAAPTGDVAITNYAGGLIQGDRGGIFINSSNTFTLINVGTIKLDVVNARAAGESSTLAGAVWGELNGSIVNTGTISANAVGTEGSSAFAAGIVTNGEVGLTIANGGTISADASATSRTAAAYGVLIGPHGGGGMAGKLDNNSIISATATAEPDSLSPRAFAAAVGIYVGGDLGNGEGDSASITNSAIHSINVKATGTFVGAIGIQVGEHHSRGTSGVVQADATITNAGMIDVVGFATEAPTPGPSGTSQTASASATGILVRAYLAGTVTNTGTIDVTASVSGSNPNRFEGAEAYGIYVDNAVAATGSVTNDETIHATAIGDVVFCCDSREPQAAAGIWVAGSSGGAITNNGTITAKASVIADGGLSSVAAGIHVQSMLSGATLTNAGTINAKASSAPIRGGGSFLDIGAVGISIGFLNAGATVRNSGTINADTVDGGPGSGWAMYVEGGGSSGAVATIQNDGTMNGNIVLNNASFNNNGKLSLPVVGEGFALNASHIDGGNYTQSATGVLEIGAFSPTQYGRLEVAGTADISAAGTFAVKVAPDDQLVAGAALDNVLHAGNLVDNPANFSVTDNSAAWDFTAVDDGAGGIDLTIAGHTEPLLAAQSVQVANVNLDELSSVVMGRMVTRRLLVERSSHDQNLWLRSYGTTGSQDDDGDIPGYDIDSYGVVIGYDDNITEHWNAGAAFAYSNADIKAKGPLNDKIDTDFYQGAVYAYWQGAGHDYLDLMAIYGKNSNDSTREIPGVPSANGDYDGWYTRLSSEVGKGFPLSDSITLIPSASVSYTYVKEDGYDESGAGGLNLNVDSNDASSLIFGLDGQIAFSMGKSALLTAHVGAGYDALTDETSLTSSFVGGTPFTTEGNKPDEWLGRAGVGAEVVAGDRIEMHVNYEYEYRDTFTDNLMAATLRWKI